MFRISFNQNLSNYIVEKYSLQKLSEIFNLTDINSFQKFFITLYNKGLLPNDEENLILNGDYKLVQNKNGFNKLTCSYYDNIEWDDFEISYRSEHGNGNKIISNAEIFAVKDYILS